MTWLDFRSDEISEYCFNAQQMSVKEGIRKYGQKEKDSVIKEIRNLAEKNSYFSKIEYETLT